MEDKMIPSSCKGVKCMIKDCHELAEHKVGEQNIWDGGDYPENDELSMHKQFRRQHELTTYLCKNHFDWLMSRDENVNMKDNRFEHRNLQ